VTLSSWLRDYLYIPLGGNRHGVPRAAASLLITMVLGGLWHGAGWTFVAWGAIHGTCLSVERLLWRPAVETRWWNMAVGFVFTQLCVLVAWIFFRAPAFEVAASVLRGITGVTGYKGDFPRELGMALPLSVPVIAHNVLARIGQEKLLEAPWLAGAICGILVGLLVAYPASNSLFIYYTF
jgi:alginate O-acetyltransferase complex protein AlgI